MSTVGDSVGPTKPFTICTQPNPVEYCESYPSSSLRIGNGVIAYYLRCYTTNSDFRKRSVCIDIAYTRYRLTAWCTSTDKSLLRK